MEYINIGTGLFIVVMGFLVKRFPNLIAGYNTMSPERKEKVDINRLSNWMSNCLVFMGILMIGGPYLFNYLGLEGLANNIILVATLGVFPFLILNAQRYDRNTSNKRKTYLINIGILLLIGAFVGGILTYGTYPPTVELNKRTLVISGMYGISRELTSVELTQNLPEITMRTNGFYFNEVSKGDFKMENGGTVKLFLQSKNGPFIMAQSIGNVPIFINRGTTEETEQLFEKLKSRMD